MADKIIDPAPVIKRLANRCLAVKGMECTILGEMIDMLRAEPAVDAVEVVRCKHCVSFGVYECTGNGYCMHYKGLIGPKPYDFCSYGERREGE